MNYQFLTSREWDKEAGIYFYRARYYDANLGRFLTEDPIGFQGGDVNFYSYVQNDPVNYTDPEGLKPKWTCVATCNLQCYNNCGKIPGSPRVKGIGEASSQEGACRLAKRAAVHHAPKGCYARHCKCKCSK